ncbi:hypothetical protein [Roseivirga pacifica]|uniref:hypothetical protein n=1 Tax=Roseivirga pacifica TaxID=1267423 RepID=UPI00209587D8|nr:hypothetical protein [Roseivirga pacifica]
MTIKREFTEPEVSIIVLLNVLLKNKKRIAVFVVSCLVLSFIYSSFIPKQYRTVSVYIPEISGETSFGGSLGGLANLAGIDLGGSDNQRIDPQLYPKILSGTNFLSKSLKEEFSLGEDGVTITLGEYLIDGVNSTPMEKLFGLFSSKPKLNLTDKEHNTQGLNVLSVTPTEQSLINSLRKKISASLDKKTGTITITSEFQNKHLAVQVADYARSYLSEFVTEYQLGKHLRRLDFLNSRIIDVEKRFSEVQIELAQFKDKNIGSLTNVALVELQNIESRYSLQMEILSTLEKQKEETKLQIDENRPTLTVLEPIVFPTKKSYPSKLKILILTFLVSLILVSMYYMVKDLYFKFYA